MFFAPGGGIGINLIFLEAISIKILLAPNFFNMLTTELKAFSLDIIATIVK